MAKRKGWRPAAFNPHDPVYTLGWIVVIDLMLGAVMLLVGAKVPPQWWSIGVAAGGALAMAARGEEKP